MLVETKSLRERVFDFINNGSVVAAMYMVSGKEPTGNIVDDLKNVRAINLLSISKGTSALAGNVTLDHRANVFGYCGLGAKNYQDGSLNDELYVDAYPVCVYPESLYSAFDATQLLGIVQMLAGYYPQTPFETAGVPTYAQNVSPGNMIVDYGSVFSFRKLSQLNFGNHAYNGMKIEYSTDAVTWTALTVANVRVQTFNFDARYLRYSLNAGNASVIRASFSWKVLNKANAFTQETVDKIVLVAATGNMQFVNGSSDFTTKQNYIGLVLDIGTDCTVSQTKTGTAQLPYFHSCRIAFGTTVVEA